MMKIRAGPLNRAALIGSGYRTVRPQGGFGLAGLWQESWRQKNMINEINPITRLHHD